MWNWPNKWNHSVQFCFEFKNKKNSKTRQSSLLWHLFKIFRWSQDPFHGRPVLDDRLLDAYTPPRVDVSHCRLVKPTSHKPHNVLLINNWRFVFFRLELSFDLPTYVNGRVTASVFWMRSPSWCLIVFANFSVSCSSDTCCLVHIFPVTFILAKCLMVFSTRVSG